MAGKRTKLGPSDEVKFQKWYGRWASEAGIDPNPDDPEHRYDYRGAFKAGASPQPDPTDANRLHWPGRWKDPDHPTYGKRNPPLSETLRDKLF